MNVLMFLNLLFYCSDFYTDLYTNCLWLMILQSALSNLGDMRAGRESGYRDRRSAGPGGGGYSPGSSLGSVRPSRRSDQTTSPNPHSYQMHPSGGLVQAPQISGSVGSPNLSGSTGAGSGGNNGGLSTNVAYLSPPLDPCWRRHSDSALHQAAMVSGDGVIGNASTNLSRRGIVKLALRFVGLYRLNFGF